MYEQRISFSSVLFMACSEGRSSMTQMTKKALATSLKQLMRKKPLSQITIQDITQSCNLSRMTFYYHFKDIYDLVEWIFVEEIVKPASDRSSYSTWQQGLLNFLQALKKNRFFLANVCRYISKEYVEQFLYEVIFNLILETIQEQPDYTSMREEDALFMANFYKYALVGILLNWIDTGMKESPTQLVNSLNAILSKNFLQEANCYQLEQSNLLSVNS
jgi:probable dihydroxyacetone kinase regulator